MNTSSPKHYKTTFYFFA